MVPIVAERHPLRRTRRGRGSRAVQRTFQRGNMFVLPKGTRVLREEAMLSVVREDHKPLWEAYLQSRATFSREDIQLTADSLPALAQFADDSAMSRYEP
jgi:hypothetical protein